MQVRAEIRNQRALREYDMAEFYAKNDYYGAARHYYDKVVEEYPDTKLAEQSRDRMSTSYQDRPANPDAAVRVAGQPAAGVQEGRPDDYPGQQPGRRNAPTTTTAA